LLSNLSKDYNSYSAGTIGKCLLFTVINQVYMIDSVHYIVKTSCEDRIINLVTLSI